VTITAFLPRLAAAAAGLWLAAGHPAVAAEGLAGTLTLASEQVERGVSQSGGQASLAADLNWAHRSGAYLGLGLASVDTEQFGGARVQWSPRLGWRLGFGDAQRPSTVAVGLSGHYFPGADGQRAGALPPRVSGTLGTQAQRTDFATVELNLALSHAGFTLALDRALTDYYGIGEESVQTGPVGQGVPNKLAGSVGSWHVGLSYYQAFGECCAAWAGIGRQVIKNFGDLDYTDWTLGASLNALGLVWALDGSGNNAKGEFWRLQRGSGETRELAAARVTASVTWEF
jgi:hypothetical protein